MAIAYYKIYITAEELNAGEEKYELVFKLVNGYIAYPDKSKKGNVSPNS